MVVVVVGGGGGFAPVTLEFCYLENLDDWKERRDRAQNDRKRTVERQTVTITMLKVDNEDDVTC